MALWQCAEAGTGVAKVCHQHMFPGTLANTLIFSELLLFLLENIFRSIRIIFGLYKDKFSVTLICLKCNFKMHVTCSCGCGNSKAIGRNAWRIHLHTNTQNAFPVHCYLI